MSNQKNDKEKDAVASAVDAIVTPQGIYKVVEDDCADYYVKALNEEDALKSVTEHLLETAFNESDLEHVSLKAEKLDDAGKLTINYDGVKVQLSAAEWYAIASVANFEWNILACTEWV